MENPVASRYWPCFIVLSGAAAMSAHAAGTESSQVWIQGKLAGLQTADYADDGTLKLHYEYNDRGRGPKIDSQYAVAKDGSVTSLDTGGVNYLKSEIHETFSRDGAKASWKNGAENASLDNAGTAFYLSLDSAPEEFVLMTRAMLAAPGHSLKILPAGEAHIEKIASQRVKGKAGSKNVTLYAISGLDLTPSYLWLDDQQRFFATWSSWQSTVRDGYEGSLEDLGKRQQAEEDRLGLARAQKLTQRIERPLVLDHVRVFDPISGSITPDQAVLIEGGKVTRVAALADLQPPRDAEMLDGHGQFLMPGLWDMHAHYSGGYEGLLDIAAGVTTVRDLANDADALAAHIKDIEAGKDIGPRIIKAGFVDGHSPYSGPTKVFVDSEDDAKKAVDNYAATGYEQIKIYSSIKPELMPVIARLAHAKGLRVSGHVPAFMSPRQFVEGGADEMQHINFVLMGLVTDVAKDDTRTPLRFTAIAEHAAGLDLGSPEVREWVEFLHQRGTVIDPTISTFEEMFVERPGQPGPTMNAWVSRLPATWQRSIRSGTGGLPMTDAKQGLYRESWQRMIDMVGLLYRSGVKLVSGTDGIGGMQLARELELYVAAGIPPKDALRIATVNGAEVMKRGDRYGRIAPGYVADMVLIDGDPTLNIADVRKTRLVIRGDRRFDPAAMYTALGVKPN